MISYHHACLAVYEVYISTIQIRLVHLCFSPLERQKCQFYYTCVSRRQCQKHQQSYPSVRFRCFPLIVERITKKIKKPHIRTQPAILRQPASHTNTQLTNTCHQSYQRSCFNVLIKIVGPQRKQQGCPQYVIVCYSSYSIFWISQSSLCNMLSICH